MPLCKLHLQITVKSPIILQSIYKIYKPKNFFIALHNAKQL